MARNIVAITMVVLLCSCTTGRWYKEGAGAQEYSEVNFICLKEAQQPQANASANFDKIYRNNSPHFSSNYSSGMVTNQTLFNACMNAHGFYWVMQNNGQF